MINIILGAYARLLENKFSFKNCLLLLLLFPECIYSQTLHSSPSCEGNQQIFSLDWGSQANQYDWTTDGQLFQKIYNVDGSGHDFTFTFSGDTDKYSTVGGGDAPNVNSFYSGAIVNVLGQQMISDASVPATVVLNIDLFPPMPAKLAFDVYHVNTDGLTGDKVSIAAYFRGNLVATPTFQDNGTPSWENPAPGVINATSSSVSGTNDQAGVNFSSNAMIDQLQIVWEECTSCLQGDHGFGIGAISFCSPGPDRDEDGVADLYDIDDDNDGLTDVYETCLNTPVPAAPDSSTIGIRIQLDAFPDETSWELYNSSAELVASGGPYSRMTHVKRLVEVEQFLPVDEYTFTIYDQFSDGICCSQGNGYYEILLNGRTSLGGLGNGSFGNSASENFNSGNIFVSPFYCLTSDPQEDDDNDGIPNYQDSDFCTLNNQGVCQEMDTDGDGIPDFYDLDSDNDGIPDLIEAGGIDADGNGKVDAFADLDGDGLADDLDNDLQDGPQGNSPCADYPSCLFAASTSALLDKNQDGINEVQQDRDQDDLPDFKDLDSDNDGLTDLFELNGPDTDANGIIDDSYWGANGYGATFDPEDGGTPMLLSMADDSDGNALPEYSALSNFIADSDNDDVPDFQDVDSDNDGLHDNYEAQPTALYIAPGNLDSDNDGILDNYDDVAGFGGKGLDVNIATTIAEAYDHDGDLLPDYRDKDSDDDLIPDIQESWDSMLDGDSSVDNPIACDGTDADADGLLACFDVDDTDITVFGWATPPVDDNGSTDNGQTASSGQLFSTGSSLDLLLPDNGGQQSGEPDFRDVIQDCNLPKIYYGISEQSGNTATDFEYDPATGMHANNAATGRTRATASCEPLSDGWYYFYNPLEPENFLFSIRNSSGSPNTVPIPELIDYVEIQLENNPASFRQVSGTGSACLVMERDWTIELKGTPTTGSTFDVKFYFDPSELTAIDQAAEAIMGNHPNAVRSDLMWFKKSGGLTNNDINASGVDSMEDITTMASERFDPSTGMSIQGSAYSTDGNSNDPGNGKNYVEFRGLASFSGGTALISIDFDALPVELSLFKGSARGCKVDLNWNTASEENFDYFELERSDDAGSFKPLAILYGFGSTSGSGYHYQDETAGNQNYYRLKMVDFDGSYQYSPVIAVSTACALSENGIELFPNPLVQSEGLLNLRVKSRKEKATIIITDPLYRHIRIEEFRITEGWNALNMDVSMLAPGIYFVLHKEGIAKQAQRLVIVER